LGGAGGITTIPFSILAKLDKRVFKDMDKEQEKNLRELRDKIDDIDNRIQKLLIRRTGIVAKVRKLKEQERVKIRPAREAEMIYRLMERHAGPFGRREMFRMWREIIVATLAMEGPFSVAVHMPKRSGDLWDMARDHFGSFTEMKSYSSVRGVIDAVHSQKKTVGVLTYPRPGADDKDPWWRHLMLESAEAPKVVARLPFAGPGNIRDKTAEALVVCPVPQEPTGRDRSLIAMELMPEASRDGIDAAMERARIKTTFQSRHADADNRDIWRYLVEVEGFVKPRDGRLGKLAGDLDEQLIRLVNIGGYATPLTPEDLDGPDPRANEDPRA